MAKRVVEAEKRIEEIEETEEVVFIRQCDKEDNTDPYGRLLEYIGSNLHKAVQLGRDKALVNALIHKKTLELFQLNDDNDTVLHVAARAGHIDIIHILLEAYADFENSSKRTEDYDLDDMKDIVLWQNKQGNTVLHEAMMCKKNDVGNLIFSALEKKYNKAYDVEDVMKDCYDAAFRLTNNARKSVLYLAVDSGYKKAVTQILDHPNRGGAVSGLSRKDTGEAQGQANNLHHAMFHMFITCITISLFSSIIATITLFWARLGLTNLVIFSLKIVMPLLGIALVSLSLAFMAGIYTVISKLTWLANFFLVMTVIFVIVLVCLYMLLFFPSTSTNIITRRT